MQCIHVSVLVQLYGYANSNLLTWFHVSLSCCQDTTRLKFVADRKVGRVGGSEEEREESEESEEREEREEREEEKREKREEPSVRQSVSQLVS